MLKIILTVGAPASGKSFWAKAEVAKDPQNWVRINNDDLRLSFNGGDWSQDYEKLVADTRNFLIREALKRNKSIIIDNVNANKRHWETACDLAQKSGRDVQVFEKAFYEPLSVLLERDAKREGKAKVGEEVIKKWFKELGKDQFKFYKPKNEVFLRQTTAPRDKIWKAMVQNENLPRAVVFDNDGTIALIGNRSPYDASNCDEVDLPHVHVIEAARLYYKAGYKILFVSGREEKDRAPTERFYQKHLPDIAEYELFMRPTGDKRKDVIIKEEIFENQIKDKYFVAGWYDDRLQVSKWIYESGLPLFRVGDPEATF